MSGHRGSLDEMKRVRAEDWRQDVDQGLKECEKRAQGAPIYGIGFSTGALVLADLQSRRGKRFERQILLAPALSLRPFTLLMKPLSSLSGRVTIPSAGPIAYRANPSGTTLAAYKSLFAIYDEMRKAGKESWNTPTLLFANPRDELIHFQGLRKLVSTHNLTNWELTEVDNRESTYRDNLHHLIIDPVVAGDELWKQMAAKMLLFLK
jgi:hypothetical protein